MILPHFPLNTLRGDSVRGWIPTEKSQWIIQIQPPVPLPSASVTNGVSYATASLSIKLERNSNLETFVAKVVNFKLIISNFEYITMPWMLLQTLTLTKKIILNILQWYNDDNHSNEDAQLMICWWQDDSV